MERNNQNFELLQKFNSKPEECSERRVHSMFTLSRQPSTASNKKLIDGMHCNSSNSSYQSVDCNCNVFEEEDDDENEIDNDEDDDGEDDGDGDGDGENSGDNQSQDKRYNKKHRQEQQQISADEMGTILKAKLSRYKKELKAYNSTTKVLTEKYMKINNELSEMQQKHDRFVANRKNAAQDSDTFSDSTITTTSSSGSEYSLRPKQTQVFHAGSGFMKVSTPLGESSGDHAFNNTQAPDDRNTEPQMNSRKKPPVPDELFEAIKRNCQAAVALTASITHEKKPTKWRSVHNKENEMMPPNCESSAGMVDEKDPSNLKDCIRVLKNVIDNVQKSQNSANPSYVKELQATVSILRGEQSQFRTVIQQQQNCLQDYFTRCQKAQRIMQSQQKEIEKLNSNNKQLESEINVGIDQLRSKIDAKLRDVRHLPQLVRDEQAKYEKVAKDNATLNDRLQELQNEAKHLKSKLEESNRRKAATINRLRAAERDLKIFKTYNASLKSEKRKLADELVKVREQLENLQNSSKRLLSRQREQSEKQRRELQKRVYELELKLNRSHNSTSGLIQERDSLIAELQTQLNTLVHNFEVSQKHIRVLRRHIYAISGGNVRANSRLLNENR